MQELGIDQLFFSWKLYSLNNIFFDENYHLPEFSLCHPSQSKFFSHSFHVVCNRNIYYIVGSDECKSVHGYLLETATPHTLITLSDCLLSTSLVYIMTYKRATFVLHELWTISTLSQTKEYLGVNRCLFKNIIKSSVSE